MKENRRNNSKTKSWYKQSRLRKWSPRFSLQPNKRVAIKSKNYHLEELKPLRKMESPNFMSFLQLDEAALEMAMEIVGA